MNFNDTFFSPLLDIRQAVTHLKEVSMQHEKTVFRQFSLPVSVFDHLKQFQRDYQAKHGVHLTNNEVLSIIVKQHQTMTANEEGAVPSHDRSERY